MPRESLSGNIGVTGVRVDLIRQSDNTRIDTTESKRVGNLKGYWEFIRPGSGKYDVIFKGGGTTPEDYIYGIEVVDTTLIEGVDQFVNDTPPNGSFGAGSTPIGHVDNKLNAQVTIEWTYTQGAEFAQGFIIRYEHGSGSTQTVDTTSPSAKVDSTVRKFSINIPADDYITIKVYPYFSAKSATVEGTVYAHANWSDYQPNANPALTAGNLPTGTLIQDGGGNVVQADGTVHTGITNLKDGKLPGDATKSLENVGDATARTTSADAKAGSALVRAGSAGALASTAKQDALLADNKADSAIVKAGSADVRSQSASIKAGSADVRSLSADVRSQTAKARADTAIQDAADAFIKAGSADVRSLSADARSFSADTKAGSAQVAAASAEAIAFTAKQDALLADNKAGSADVRASSANIRAGSAGSQATSANAQANTARIIATSAVNSAKSGQARANTAQTNAVSAQNSAKTAYARAKTAGAIADSVSVRAATLESKTVALDAATGSYGVGSGVQRIEIDYVNGRLHFYLADDSEIVRIGENVIGTWDGIFFPDVENVLGWSTSALGAAGSDIYIIHDENTGGTEAFLNVQSSTNTRFLFGEGIHIGTLDTNYRLYNSGALLISETDFQVYGGDLYIGNNTTTEGHIWHDGSILWVENLDHGGGIALRAESAGGVIRYTITGDADGAATLWYAGSSKLATASDGIDVTGKVDATGDIDAGGSFQIDGSDIIDDSGYQVGILKTRVILPFSTTSGRASPSSTYSTNTYELGLGNALNGRGYTMPRSGKITAMTFAMRCSASSVNTSPPNYTRVVLTKNGTQDTSEYVSLTGMTSTGFKSGYDNAMSGVTFVAGDELGLDLLCYTGGGAIDPHSSDDVIACIEVEM